METVSPIYIAILLYIAAVGMALVDLYIPSAGMLLILAFVAAVGSVMFGFRAGTTSGMTMLTVVAASVPILAVIAMRVWPQTPVARRIVLKLPSQPPTNSASEAEALDVWIGCVVDSEYPLMPAGQLTIGRKPFNAMAEAGYIDAGQRVEVVAVRQRNLIVRPTHRPLTVLPKPNSPTNSPVQTDLSQAPSNLLDVPAEELGLDSIEE